MQLKVIKADGSVEDYLHTKIVGTIGNVLARTGQADICIAEQLAEVITYFLYHEQNRHRITSGEIFSIIKATLTTTGYEEAALALSEHHFGRKLKRCRIEVISVNISELADAEAFCGDEELCERSRWDKSRIVEYLITKYSIRRQTTRMIASIVEEKIFGMGVTSVPASLVKQLVLSDAAVVLRAERQLQTV